MDFPDCIDFPTKRPLRLLQITDCHLGEYPGEELLGLNTDASLHDVLALVAKEPADLIVNTGDVSSHGHIGSYARYQGLVDSYVNVPHAWLPGNHDLPSAMDAAVPGGKSPKVIEAGPWQFILLDSSVPRCEHGDLTSAELTFLAETLSASEKPALVFIHHQPQAVGSLWIDQYTVRSKDAFFALVDACPRVKGIVWGHVHQVFDQMRGHIRLMASPSTCIQFLPNNDEFALDHAMPGLRWFELNADGTFETGVKRVEYKDYPIDFNSTGY